MLGLIQKKQLKLGRGAGRDLVVREHGLAGLDDAAGGSGGGRVHGAAHGGGHANVQGSRTGGRRNEEQDGDESSNHFRFPTCM